jgi:hypothetical protein
MYDKQYVTMCNILPLRAQNRQAGLGRRLVLGWSGPKLNLCSVTRRCCAPKIADLQAHSASQLRRRMIQALSCDVVSQGTYLRV